ncbi:hypothetical protein UPYG_G00020680 [Umbra pygmaea]|uniref:Fibronectin type-III domain-containing protein n=1 Tax=Umbra pygmaea TaxID=75934 RepID=A0ABD0XKP6_UMBPY
MFQQGLCVVFWLCVYALVSLHSGVFCSNGMVTTVPSGKIKTYLEPPSRPDVHCWSPSYPFKVLCSWPEPPQSQRPTHYIATYSLKDGEIQQCHPYPTSMSPLPSPELSLQRANSSSPGTRWFCILEGLKLYTTYQLNITAVNPLGSVSHLQLWTIEDIVKPDPPVNVTVQVVPRTLKLLVRWAPPPSWSDHELVPLNYRVRYQWEKEGTFHDITLGPFKETERVLPGLLPGRVYLVQVCSMEYFGLGQNSDWSPPVNVTMPAD